MHLLWVFQGLPELVILFVIIIELSSSSLLWARSLFFGGPGDLRSINEGEFLAPFILVCGACNQGLFLLIVEVKSACAIRWAEGSACAPLKIESWMNEMWDLLSGCLLFSLWLDVGYVILGLFLWSLLPFYPLLVHLGHWQQVSFSFLASLYFYFKIKIPLPMEKTKKKYALICILFFFG